MTATMFTKACAAHHPGSSGPTRTALLGRTALCGVLSLGVVASLAPRPAKAGPEGGAVVQGGATIQSAGSHTEITQTTQSALITWQNFSIGTAESVTFAQPNTKAVALNKVTTDIPSNIQGQLTANGQVWIINPNGVFVGKDAAVNVGGLVATSADLVQQDWDAGKYTFEGAPAGSQVKVDGSVTATDGSIVLVAPMVDVSGGISAAGDVALGAGSGFSVDFQGDGLTRFAVDAATGAKLNVSGTISAQGGAAYLVGAATDAVEDSVVSVGGRVEATRIEERGGVIVISGGETGVTEISGTVDASQDDGAGGEVKITGGRVALTETAVVDASGATDGGKVEIGGGFRGGAIASGVAAISGAPQEAPLPTAKRTSVAEGARIAANAGAAGDGGTVIVWADGQTSFSGHISATGGATGGDGGFAEVSGRQGLMIDGTVDLTDAFGGAGTLLLDPDDFTVSTAATAVGNLNSGDLQTLLQGADVTLNTAAPPAGVGGAGGPGDITLVDGLGALDLLGNSRKLTLLAENNIASNAAIGESTGVLSLDFQAANLVTVTGAISIDGTFSSASDDMAMSAAITAAGGVTIANPGGGIGFGATAVDGFQLTDAEADLIESPLTLDAAGNITVDEITFDQVTTLDATGTVDFLNNSSTFDQALTAIGTEIDIGTGVTLTVANDQTLTLVNAAGDGVAFGGNDSGNANAFIISNNDLGRIAATHLAVRTASGDVTVDANNGNGNDFDLSAFTSVELEGADVDIDENDQVVIGSGGSGTFLVTHGSNTGDIVLGGSASGFALTDADIAKISAATLVATTRQGDIEVREINFTGGDIDTLRLSAEGGLVFFNETGGGGDGDAITGLDQLDVSAADVDVDTNLSINMATGGAVNLTNAADDLVTLGSQSGTPGTFDLTGNEMDRFDTDTLTVTTAANIVLDGASADNAGELELNAGTGVAVNGASSLDNDLVINSGGNVTQTAALSVGGETTIDAGANTITLTDTGNDFNRFNAVAADITVTDGDDIQLGDITSANNLIVTAAGTITDVGVVNVTTATNLLAYNGTTDYYDIVLDGGPHTFGALTAEGEDIAITQAGDLVLGAITLHAGDGTVDPTIAGNTGSLFATATGAGNITQSAALTVPGTASFTAVGDDVTLTLAGNDFNEVDANADNVTVYDANGITLDDVTVSNDLFVYAMGGGITDADGVIDVGGTTTLLAYDGISNFFDIVLDNQSHTLGTVNAYGEDITITEADPVALGTIFLVAADGAPDNGTNTGDLIVVAAGGTRDITQTAALTVPGTASFTATGAVTLADPANDFGGAVSASGTNINLRDTNAIALADIDAGGTLNVIAGTSIDDGTAGAAGDDINVTGTTTLTAGTTITLNDGTNDFGGAVSASGTNISLSDDNSITLADIDAAGSLTVDADGSIDDGAEVAAGADVNVIGTTSLTAGTTITLDDTTNDFGGAVSANGTTVVINDANALTTGPITASGPVTLGASDYVITGTVNTAEATLTDPTGLGFALGDTVNLPGTRISVTSAEANLFTGNVTFETAADFRIGGFTFNDANGATSRNATLDAGTSVVFDGAVTAAASFEADLAITAPGGVSQGFFDGAYDNVVVAGVTSILSAGAPIDLNNAFNDFGGRVDAQGTNVDLFDANALTLGDIDATGSLYAYASGGALTQTATSGAGTGVDVGGTSQLYASGAVTLDAADNEFTGAVSSFGTNISLRDRNSITLADIDAGGTLTVEAGGAIDDGATVGAGSDVNVTGATTLIAATTITLDDSTNAFGGAVSASGTDISLRDADSITLADIDASGTLAVQAAAAIDDGAEGDDAYGVSTDVDVGGTTTLTAGTTITLNDATNSFSGAISASGTAITLQNNASILLGDIEAASLNVSSGGSITDGAEGDLAFGGTTDVDVTGNTTLTATDSITLDDTTNSFGGVVDAVSTTGSISLADANALILGTVSTGNDLTVLAGGSVTDTPGRTITVGGATTITAQSGGNYFDIVLDNPGTPTDIDTGGTTPAPAVHDFNTIDVTGEDILIRDVNAITVTASGNSDGSPDPTLGAAYNVTIHTGPPDQVATISPNGSVVVQSGVNAGDGDLTIRQVTAAQDVLLTASGDLIVLPDGFNGVSHGGIPVHADQGDIWLVALNGSFAYWDTNLADAYAGASNPGAVAALPGAENLIPAGTMFDAPSGNIGIVLQDAFKVIVVQGNTPIDDPQAPAEPSLPVLPDPYDNYAFVLNTARDGVALISVQDGEIAVGSIPIIEGVLTQGGAFDALGALGNLSASFQDLFVATGNLALESRNSAAPVAPTDPSVSLIVENTASSIGAGAGTRVIGVTYLGGYWENIGIFGSFNGIPGQTAAISGFSTQTGYFPPGGRQLQISNGAEAITGNLGNFVINPDNRANGCIIGLLSSCQPLGRVILFLDIEDGSLLAFRFQDDEEEEDDPFSNRGDEEEWQ